MRLKCIKLAGFKSFVDPTTVNFPSNMAAVVGPNGCGKSNIIDAVRWVMGESSAKNLRGESMTDVIFNGSNSRKPVGQASIELLFDNSDGSLQGEYGAYAEISIRRRVTRDGQNTYFLNGTKCRRRDITDIFLGTGLGPRSYSIIEQGMISRLIEARPEDLRHFLEEAAGISKYKERRRETENRIRRTQENLERLTDLREELGRQLERLQRQAQAAERYQAYKQEEYGLQGQLLALRWRALEQQGVASDSVLREHEVQYEAQVASQRKADADIERWREQHHESSETFNQVQGRFYAVGAEIARIEQSIQHAQQRSRQLEEDWQRAQQEQQMAVQAQQDDAAQLQQLQEECAELESLVELLREDKAAAAETQETAEAQWQSWQEQTNQLARDGAEPKRQADVQQARIAQLESSLERIREQAQRLQDESARLEDPQDETELLAEQLAVAEAQAEDQVHLEAQASATLTSLQQQARESRVRRDQLFAEYQQQQGRLASLDALQEAALASDQGVQEWLSQQCADQALVLAEQIQVDAGWESAVELVLAQALSAACLAPDIEALRQFEQGDLLLLSPVATDVHPDSVLNHVRSDIDLSAWLGSVRAVETLEQAWALREQLAHGESVVSRDGYWLGPHFVRVVRQGDAQASVLARAQELLELRANSELLAAQLETAESDEVELQQQLAQQQEALTQLRRTREEQSREVAKFSALLSAQTAKADQLRQRRESLAVDQQRLHEQRVEETELLSEARLMLEAALEAMAQCELRHEQLLAARDGLRQGYEQGRTQLQQLTQQEHQTAMQLADRQARLVALEAALARLKSQHERASERLEELAAIRLEGQQPIAEWQDALQEQLALRMDVESALQQARASLEDADHQLRESERQRLIAEQHAGSVREQLEQLRLQRQTLSVRQQTLADELQREGWQVADILAALPESAEITHWESELKLIAERIARLGAINLAAIEEYQQQGERKHYLDAQDQDLTDALSTLESVIQKIDRETRQRFKETFDKVNDGLQALFPKVFGGGTAYLELTGEDLLDTGVAIMARPPGKKNSTIHLLSGGEKALTALALVFAIFQLNPAPFCMLDEVDAPLDDANVGRYARLVKEMSQSVQFIYITHNKIAMEMADQLMGVTMHEPGCSRLVAVDVEQALAMVES